MAEKKNTPKIQNWIEASRAMEEEQEAERSEHIWRVIAAAASSSKSEGQEAWTKAQWEAEEQKRQEKAAGEGL